MDLLTPLRWEMKLSILQGPTFIHLSPILIYLGISDKNFEFRLLMPHVEYTTRTWIEPKIYPLELRIVSLFTFTSTRDSTKDLTKVQIPQDLTMVTSESRKAS